MTHRGHHALNINLYTILELDIARCDDRCIPYYQLICLVYFVIKITFLLIVLISLQIFIIITIKTFTKLKNMNCI